MTTFLKKLNLGAIVALVGIVGLTVSWKNHESKKLAPQYYAVSITDTSDPNNEANMQIDGPISEPTSGPCTLSSGYVCAVQLDLNGAPKPATIKAARDGGFDTDVRKHKSSL